MSSPAPHNLLLVNTLATVQSGVIHVRVANLGDEDVWLKPRTRIGVIHAANEVQATSKTAVVWRQAVPSELDLIFKKRSQSRRMPHNAPLTWRTMTAPRHRRTNCGTCSTNMLRCLLKMKMILVTRRQSNITSSAQMTYPLPSHSEEFLPISSRR